MSAEPKIAREVAIVELKRLCEARRLVVPEPLELPKDENGEPPKDEKTGEPLVFFALKVEQVLALIGEGRIEVEEDGTAVCTPRFTPGAAPFKFGTPTGAMYLAQDNHKGGHHQNMAMLGVLTGRPIADFGKLHARDYETVVALLELFLR